MTDILAVKGVGPAVSEKLAKLGICTISDLLKFLPKAYVDLKSPVRPSSVSHGDFAFFKAKISGTAELKKGRKVTTVTVRADCDGEFLKIVFFNQPYYADKFKEDEEYLFLGKVSKSKGAVELVNPVFEAADKQKNLKGFYTAYPLRGVLGQSVFKNLMREALMLLRDTPYAAHLSEKEIAAEKGSPPQVPEANSAGKPQKGSKKLAQEKMSRNFCDTPLVDDETRKKFGLYSAFDAFKAAHFPGSGEDIAAAHKAMLVEDTVGYICAFKLLRSGGKKDKGFCYRISDEDKRKFFEALGFEFTPSQKTASEEIERDMAGRLPMNRILAGDVGSGKTAVAFYAAYVAAVSGYQSVMMAPTEILAVQHFEKAKQLFGKLGFEVALLTSSVSAAERRTMLGLLKAGYIDFLVGTHAVFQDDVEFKNLAVVMTDEQHRFGVAQKSSVEKKGEGVDALVLSATPIPRALSLILYDDLGLSVLENRADRSNVATKIITDAKLPGLYSYIAEEAGKGRQAFIVCPRISDSEGMDLYSAETLFEELKKGALKNIGTGLLHGKMSAEEKEEVLTAFKAGKIKVLVSTTVIEVGIDVQAASIMAILNSERFGLAALHQLRGRVGRSGEPAYCFLHTAKAGGESIERLEILKNFTDGFKIAEMDFDLRGGGDFLGLNQSGDMTDGRYQVKLTRQLIKEAKAVSDELFDSKRMNIGSLVELPVLQKYIEKMKNVTIN